MGTKYAPFNNISIKLRGSDLLTEEKHKLFHRKEHFTKVLFQSWQPVDFHLLYWLSLLPSQFKGLF
jgi:hypothetical protein